ncbi:MAG TPA: hypothetical protein VHD32_05315 [Candidatus Didemnitutus sp.]|nr:hypothetical protein [Candidatus Didemnitutus sp.]
MSYRLLTITLLDTFALAGCQSEQTGTQVAPDSELGKIMQEMDARGRAHQNEPRYSKALQEYEAGHGGACNDLKFVRLQEPGQVVSQYVSLYTMEGFSEKCGRRSYHTRITFRDTAHTVATRVEVLDQVTK